MELARHSNRVEKIDTAIVDDSALRRELIANAIASNEGCGHETMATEPEALGDLLDQGVADVVILTVPFDRANELKAIRRIKAAGPHAQVVIFSLNLHPQIRETLMDCGADAYADQRDGLKQLLEVIHDVTEEARWPRSRMTVNPVVMASC